MINSTSRRGQVEFSQMVRFARLLQTPGSSKDVAQRHTGNGVAALRGCWFLVVGILELVGYLLLVVMAVADPN